jgi:hypothetical protein
MADSLSKFSPPNDILPEGNHGHRTPEEKRERYVSFLASCDSQLSLFTDQMSITAAPDAETATAKPDKTEKRKG